MMLISSPCMLVGLSADPSVLSCLSLSVLCGLQRLSPDILSQVNFSPRKLLEALDGVRGQEVCLALQINLDACGDRLSKVLCEDI